MKNIIFVLCLAALLSFSACTVATTSKTKSNDSESSKSTAEDSSQEPIESNSTTDDGAEQAGQSKTEKADALINQARDDAATATQEQLQEAYNFIYNIMAEDYRGFYKDDATMEQGIYYGALLEYSFKDINDALYDLGMDVAQAIKYVYRGAETIDDPSTQANIEQIIKDINRFLEQSQNQ